MSDPFIGEIQAFAFPFAVGGFQNGQWAACLGQILPINSNTPLFSLIGTTYGGNGTTTFGLPNLNGHIVTSQGQGPGLSDRLLGETWGETQVTLMSQQMASHTHALQLGGGSGGDPDRGTHPRCGPARSALQWLRRTTLEYDIFDHRGGNDRRRAAAQQHAAHPRAYILHCVDRHFSELQLIAGVATDKMIAPAHIVPRNPTTHVRLAAPADAPFLRDLHKSARAADFAAAGLPRAALDMLLEQQYRAQTAGYAAQFPDAGSLIILHRDEPVGRLMLLAGDAGWHVIDILLLPSARGQGIGTDVLEAIARAATEAGAHKVTLSVLFSNAGARRLYARLGFAETGGDVHVTMAKRL
jgi:ribosomal protein S18 acetylase RimI-like enzyme